MNTIELLAPAGNFEALRAAVDNGADAVYIGGEKFSARKNADNFDLDTMQRALDYAHKRKVKVYGAVNTLISDNEVDELLHYAYDILKAGIDGMIVQDIGIAHLLRETLPHLRLHASTQMAVHNTAGVRYLKEFGFKRVVLARETSLADIKAILAIKDIEIETFVHGALCVAYSGQCLLSSMIGARSGNRGQCAQPCRLKYKLVDEKGANVASDIVGEHLLSTRDLNMLHDLPKLIESGISSLKIEGRMKRPEYVAVVVDKYRKAIDNYYQTGKSDISVADDADIRQIFNRDFTNGYYFGNNGRDLMSYSRADNRGVYLGKIRKVDYHRAMIELATDLAVGDGYLILAPNHEEIAGKVKEILLDGQKVDKADKGQIVQFPISSPVPKNAAVYKTSDSALLKKAQATYNRPSEPAKSAVNFKITVKKGQPLQLEGWDLADNYAHAVSDYLVETAQKHPSDEAGIIKQLDRLGNTAFSLGQVEVILEEGVIAPASEINKLRRSVVEQLEKVSEADIMGAEYPSVEDYEDAAYEWLSHIPPKMEGYANHQLSVMVSSLAAVKAALASGADIILANVNPLRDREYFAQGDLEKALELAHQYRKRIYLAPAMINNEAQLKATEKMMLKAKTDGFDGILVTNLGILQIAKEQDWQDIAIDYVMNVFNDLTISRFCQDEAVRMTLSPELNLEQINGFSFIGNVPVEVIVHGNFPLMISEQCVVGSVAGKRSAKEKCQMPCRDHCFGLKDRMDMIFPLEMDYHCRMYVYNSKGLNLYKRLDNVLATGVDVIRIEAKEQTPQWISEVTAIYRRALDRYMAKDENIITGDDEERLAELQPFGSTYGHYFRGVF